jgi:glycosyltransferase involved in cell wall biosynthesis
MMARISGKSYSATAHAHDIFVNSESAIKEFIDTSSFIITCTRYNKKRLEEIAGNGLGNNILHLYHGIDTSKWPQKKTVSQAGAAIKIIAVGRLVEKKGFAFLLKAVLLLKNWNTNISCTIAGDGPQHDQLNKFVEDNHLQNNVFLPGAVAHTEIAKYYLEADIMVLPSIVDKKGDMDGLPNVLLEAIWVGLPVISTSVSAIEELVEDKKTGLIVPPADEHAIANGILTLGQDAVLRAYLVNNGREKIKRNFSIQQTTQTLSAIFKDLR